MEVAGQNLLDSVTNDPPQSCMNGIKGHSDECSPELVLAMRTAVCVGLAVEYQWSVSHLCRNKLAHSLHGNGGGGRRTARKRKQNLRTPVPQSNSQFSFAQIAQLLQLLTQLLNMLKGKQLSQLAGLLPEGLLGSLGSLGVESATQAPKKKKKKKQACSSEQQSQPAPIQQQTGQPATAPSVPNSGTPNTQCNSAQQPASYADAAKAGHQSTLQGTPKGKGKGKSKAAQGDAESVPKGKGKGKSKDPAFADGWQQAWTLRAVDWTAPVLTLDELGRKLDAKNNDDISVVVHVQDESQADELDILVAGEAPNAVRKINATAVLLAPKGPKGEVTIPKGRTLHNVPGKLGGKLTPRLAFVWPVCGTSPSLKREKQVSPDKPTAPTTCVVRVSTEARFFEESAWNKLHSKPAAAMQQWLANQVPKEVARKVFDMWGWGEQGSGGRSVITGLMRVEEAILPSLLTCSGKKAWFVEPLKWQTPCSVTWVKQEKQESNSDYCDRVSGMASTLGVARGLRSLGVRQPQTSGPVNKERFWKVTGAPREWGLEVLQKQLINMGLQDVSERSRKTQGKTTNWWFKAITPQDLDFFELQVDTSTLVACVVDTSAPRRKKFKPLQQDSRMVFPAKKEFPELQSTVPAGITRAQAPPQQAPPNAAANPTQSGDASAPETAPTAMDAESSQEDNKRAASSPLKSPARKKVAAQPPHGLQRRANDGHGNCLFEALGQGVDKSARTVRAAVVKHLTTHAARYTPWWDGTLPEKGNKPCASYDDYLKLLAKEGAWGSFLEVTGAAVHYDRPIAVFEPNCAASPYIFNASGKQQPLALWLSGCHYELLEGSLPVHVLGSVYSTKGPLQGGRGGGSRKTSCSSGITRLSALPPPPGPSATARTHRAASAPPSTSGTRLSALPHTARHSSNTGVSRKPLQSQADSSQAAVTNLSGDAKRWLEWNRQQTSSGSKDKPLPAADDPQPGDSTALPPGLFRNNKQPRKHWPCPFCDFVARGKLVYQLKAKHLQAWHPDQAAEADLRKKALPLQNVANLQPEEVYWKCPIASCRLGFTAKQAQENSNSALAWARQLHRLKTHPKSDPKRFLFKKTPRANLSRQKAFIATRNKGIANRLNQDLRAQPAEGHRHKWITFQWPKWCLRGGRSDVICTLCKRDARSVKGLYALPCKPVEQHRRMRRLQQLQKETSKGDEQHRREARELVELFTLPESAAGPAQQAGPHTLGELKWPAWLRKCRVTNTYCTACKRIAAQYVDLSKQPCNGNAVKCGKRKAFFEHLWTKAGNNAKRRREAKALEKQLKP